MSNDITALFNGQPYVQIVQGEDMAIAISLHGTQTSLPFDLTGIDFGISFVSVDDRTIYRSSLPAPVMKSGTVIGSANVSVTSHGFVTGDVVSVSGVSPPAPLVASASYTVTVVDANTITLQDATGTLVTFTGAASFEWFMAVAGVTVSPPFTSGIVSLMLNANFTSNIKSGTAQTFQLETFKNGQTHIYIELHELDVLEQI